MEFFNYEHMKQVLVLFSYVAVWMMIIMSYAYHIRNLVRWIIRKARQRMEKKENNADQA